MNQATDTLQIAKTLRDLDFSERQAEGLAEVVRSMDQRGRGELVTKDYLKAQLYSALFLHGLVMITAITALSKLL